MFELLLSLEMLLLIALAVVWVVNGSSNTLWAINGEVFPHTPTFVVSEENLVKMRIVNRTSSAPHASARPPYGRPEPERRAVPGSPLVFDTLPVEPGETLEVAFCADNPASGWTISASWNMRPGGWR